MIWRFATAAAISLAATLTACGSGEASIAGDSPTTALTPAQGEPDSEAEALCPVPSAIEQPEARLIRAEMSTAGDVVNWQRTRFPDRGGAGSVNQEIEAMPHATEVAVCVYAGGVFPSPLPPGSEPHDSAVYIATRDGQYILESTAPLSRRDYGLTPSETSQMQGAN